MIGWMNNCFCALGTSTAEYRGPMTLPRKLSLARIDDRLAVVQRPVLELLPRRGHAEDAPMPVFDSVPVYRGNSGALRPAP